MDDPLEHSKYDYLLTDEWIFYNMIEVVKLHSKICSQKGKNETRKTIFSKSVFLCLLKRLTKFGFFFENSNYNTS